MTEHEETMKEIMESGLKWREERIRALEATVRRLNEAAEHWADNCNCDCAECTIFYSDYFPAAT